MPNETPTWEETSDIAPSPVWEDTSPEEAVSPTVTLARAKMAFAPQVGKTMKEGPLFPIPRVNADSPAFQAVIRGITGQEPTEEMATSAAAAVNVGKSLPEFLESPMGMLTAPVGGGALGPVAARLTGLGFAGQMAAGVPEAAREAGRVSVEGTPQEQKEALLGLGSQIVLPATLAAPAISEAARVARRIIPAPKPAAVPLTKTEAEVVEPTAQVVPMTEEPPGPPVPPAPTPTPPTPPETGAPALPSLEEVQKGSPPIPQAAKGTTPNQPIRLQLADGKIVPALWNGYWEAAGTPFDKAPSIATVVAGKWSHGMLPKGAKILDEVPSFDEWKAGTATPEKITSAAYRTPEGKIETGANHPEILKRLGVTGFEDAESRNTPDFGFVTDKGRFITREQAGAVSEASGQNLKEFEPGEPVHSDEVESPTEPGEALGDVPQGIEGTVIAGKTLAEWEAIKDASQLPKGTDPKRAKLAKWLAVPNQPSRILQALGNKKRTREIHASPPTAVAPVAPDAPEATPTPAAPPAAEPSAEPISKAPEAAPAAPVPVETKAQVPETKPAPAETKPAETAPKAAAKAQTEVSKVAATEGQRPAKEVKAELVKRIEGEITNAPTGAEAMEVSIRSGKPIPLVTIEIPGDGTFKVLKAKEALTEVLGRAKRINTKPSGTPPKDIPVSSAKVGEEANKAIEAYGSAEAAYRSVKRQRDALPDNDPDTPQKVEGADALLAELFAKTKAGQLEAQAEVAKERAATYREGAEGFRKEIARIQAVKRKKQSHLDRLTDLKARYAENQLRLEQYELAARKNALEAANEKAALEAPEPPKGPGPIGMGGAALGEIQATGPRGEPTHGIAARVLEQRRLQGVIAPVEPGEGISPEESIERGRQLLSQGVDPETVLEDFNRTKAVSADGIAVVRAQGERLARTAYAMADAHGIHSSEYEAAWEADSDWAKRTKEMQTEWHKIGQAQQGETEIDTGTFHGLRHAFFASTGKDFTPKQAAQAEGIAKGVKEATEAADKAKAEVFAEVGRQARATPESAPKPGDIATPSPSTLWKRAKAMIDAGENDFDSLRHKLAQEFGIPVDEVTRILAEPKSARTITDDMYRKMAEQRRLVNQAKQWLKNEQIPGWLQFTRKVPRVFFTAKILGHGTVGMITHAGLNMFNPVAWKVYWPNFFRQYRLIMDKPYHERLMQDLLRDPLFTKARRAGLANDPFRYQDDYQTPTLVRWLDRIGLTGNRGFDALKLFRQARFNQIWNSLPDTVQTPAYAKLLADSVNHATGAIRRPFREWANWTFFAPRLEASRWAWMVKDPWDAAKTFVDWNNAAPEEKAFAMSQLKEKAAIAGTYYSLLMLNQGLLSASGSDQKINFTNPRRGDFLAFKAAGHNIGIVGPMLGMVRLFANLYHAAAGKRGKVESLTPRAGEFGQIGLEYARGKLSPFAGFGVDVISQADFQGRPMPYSTDAVPKYLRRQGLGRYTYGEYAAQEFTPIPFSEAVHETLRDQGMDDDTIGTFLKNLTKELVTVGVPSGLTGARISREAPPTNP